METQLATRPDRAALKYHEPYMEHGRRYSGAPSHAVGLALATVEALLGRRSLHQLRPRLSQRAFLQLVTLVDSGLFGRSEMGSLRTQMPSPDAIEASARISVNQRWLAVTIRLDLDENWRCSDLTVLGAPPA